MISGESPEFTWEGAEGAVRSGPLPPFLDVPMFVALFRTLTVTEQTNVELLLDAAARTIRRRIPTIAWDNPDARLVTLQVVKSVLQSEQLPDYAIGQKQYTKTVGDKTYSGVPVNPDALLLFTDYHWAQLGISPNPKPRWNFPRDDY